jgi:hypothetical protein
VINEILISYSNILSTKIGEDHFLSFDMINNQIRILFSELVTRNKNRSFIGSIISSESRKFFYFHITDHFLKYKNFLKKVELMFLSIFYEYILEKNPFEIVDINSENNLN